MPYPNLLCMLVSISVIRYPLVAAPFAFMAMILHRLPLAMNNDISFYKLMGCGKKGTFSHIPSLRQWAVMAAFKERVTEVRRSPYGRFISGWFKTFGCEVMTVWLIPTGGHGEWDGVYPFETVAETSDGPIAILTRASIRSSKAGKFWKYVAPVSSEMSQSPGLVYYLGMGEIPWIRQATFSIWESTDAMKGFAYSMQKHVEVIRKTHKEDWYKEDMYTRFRVLATEGTINGKNPLQGKL